MIKKFLCISLLIAVLFTSVLAVPAGAVDLTEHFKYTKLKNGSSFPVKLKLYGMKESFNGTLRKTNNPTDEEITKAIEETAKKMGVTMEDIIRAELAAKAAEKGEKLTEEELEQFKEDLLKVLGPLFGKAMDVMDVGSKLIEVITYYIEGSSDKTYWDVAGEWAATEGGKKSIELMAGKIDKKYGTEILKGAAGTVLQAAEILILCREQYLRDQAKWELRGSGINASRLLNEFYREVNARLEEMTKDRPEGWQILIDNESASKETSFWHISVEQTWLLNLNLVKLEGSGLGADGTYRGVMNIDVNNDVTEFDSQFTSKIFPPGEDMMEFIRPTEITQSIRFDDFEIRIGLDVGRALTEEGGTQ